MERAEPANHPHAPSTSLALRSAILVFAISRSCSIVILPDGPCRSSGEPLVMPAAFLMKYGRRRGLGDEGEGTVAERGDHDRDRHAGSRSAVRGVERLAEFHDVQAALTERRTDRRRRIGLAGRHLQLDVTDYLLCHLSPLRVVLGTKSQLVRLAGSRYGHGEPPRNADGEPTGSPFWRCALALSIRSFRPDRIPVPPAWSGRRSSTATLEPAFSSFTSSTMPLKAVNGPSLTRTCSPASNVTFGLGLSMPSWTCA